MKHISFLILFLIATTNYTLLAEKASLSKIDSRPIWTPATYCSLGLSAGAFLTTLATGIAIMRNKHIIAGTLIATGLIVEVAAIAAYFLLQEQLAWNINFKSDVLPPIVYAMLFNILSLYYAADRTRFWYTHRKKPILSRDSILTFESST